MRVFEDMQTVSPVSLEGRRILVVEDEMLVSMLIEDILLDLGCEVVGPASRVPKALEIAQSEQVDAALLDMNVAGERVFPVADALAKRGIPFAFVSGYGDEVLDAPHAGRPVVKKPFPANALEVTLRACLVNRG